MTTAKSTITWTKRRGLLSVAAALVTLSAVTVGLVGPAGADHGPVGTIQFLPSNGVPLGIVAGPDGNIWYTLPDLEKIGKTTPGGEVTTYPIPRVAGSEYGVPLRITAGPDGNLWFTLVDAGRNGKDSIGRINPKDGNITLFPLPKRKPTAITAGPDGNIWFTEINADIIGRINPDTGVITEFPLLSPVCQANSLGAGCRQLKNITTGPDGNLWFTELLTNAIGRINPYTGAISEFPVPSPDNGDNVDETDVKEGYFGITVNEGPFDITAGPDGNLWFTQSNANSIGRMTPMGLVTGSFPLPTTNGIPRGITAGPDESIWYVTGTELRASRGGPGDSERYKGGNMVGRIAPSCSAIQCSITEFPFPVEGSQPEDIIPGPAGSLDLWFTAAGSLGRITALPERIPVGVGTYEESDPNVTLEGTWINASNTANTVDSGGFVRYSTSPAPSASAELAFSGTSIKWLARRAADAGISDVYIDGVKVATVDLYNASTLYKQTVFEKTGLSSGTHTITVVRTGTKNPSASDTLHYLDAFVVPAVPVVAALRAVTDFDGDGTTDKAVFRPSTGQWFVRGGSPEVTQYGIPDDIPVPGDYDGNGTTDKAVYRPSTGVWFVQGGSPEATVYGAAGDIPVPGDFDGNISTEKAVYRPSTGQWFVRGVNPEITQYGAAGDLSMVLPYAIQRVFFP